MLTRVDWCHQDTGELDPPNTSLPARPWQPLTASPSPGSGLLGNAKLMNHTVCSLGEGSFRPSAPCPQCLSLSSKQSALRKATHT